MELSNSELLKYAIDNGMIDINTIQKQIEMNERLKYLEMHQNEIWKGKDGSWYTYLPDEKYNRGRRLIKRKTESSIIDAVVNHYKESENAPYLKRVFYEWIDGKLKYGEIQKQTYDRYEMDFNRFIDGSKISKIRFQYITEDELEDFIRQTIHEKQLTAKAWGNLRIIIVGLFKYAKKKGYTKISITNFMGDLELSSKLFKKVYRTDSKEVFTNEEVNKIVEYIYSCKRNIVNLGILLAFHTGLRSGELAALSYKDFDLKRRRIYITKTEIHYKIDDGSTVYEIREAPKTEAGYRDVVISDECICILNEIKKINPFSEYLFTDSHGYRIKEYVFSHKLYRICNKLNIVPKSIHKARKTYATKLINANVNERLIMKQMGHKDISTTRSYYSFDNLSEEEKKEQIKRAISY